MALAPLAASGCASTLPADVMPSSDPVSVTTQIREVHPADVISEFHPREAVDPKPWGQRNNEQAPRSGGAS